VLDNKNIVLIYSLLQTLWHINSPKNITRVFKNSQLIKYRIGIKMINRERLKSDDGPTLYISYKYQYSNNKIVIEVQKFAF